ncbi:hydrolase 1, exosortase A system-associated [Erythrobacter sp. LQ02-29]|uniref:hydrolase 1, exosortase A system-associated n=1 Tax=Erythrobacter sp. LQ02-29 TaxID=2920384 RepID=UPI001F4D4193|nr:hydrolase 1, exosortase A system-associated [Erythrobacter sp. LQ02-29]
MSRLHFTFPCAGETLAGTLDSGREASGLLIVTGGNEVRSGAFSGQAHLAERIAAQGFPVFRYDRRGVGDSSGANRGFEKSADDIRAAIDAFRGIAPKVSRVVAFGNGDAASALMLAGGAGCDALILSNPWTIEETAQQQDALPPPDAIRARYLSKLTNPAELRRLATGGVDLGKLARGLVRAARAAAAPGGLAQRMATGLSGFDGPTAILLATADRTAQMFEGAWDAEDSRIRRCERASHAYVEPHARDWLEAQLLDMLRA